MQIGNIFLEEARVRDLILSIKRKRELQQINDDFVRDQLYSYLIKHLAKANFLDKPRSSEYKEIIKNVRAVLRQVYGLFRLEESSQDRRRLLEELSSASLRRQKATILKILATHSSTKERLEHYENLYRELWEITGKPHKIIDLGCGINPFSIPLMGLRRLHYYASDLSEEEIALLHDFFRFLHKQNRQFNGLAEILDALHWPSLERLRKVDICFLFKMTDVLDRGRGHKITEEIMKRLPCRWIVVSFATKTMSGKIMTAPRRRWMEWLCQRLGWKYTLLEIPDELFYVVEKKQ